MAEVSGAIFLQRFLREAATCPEILAAYAGGPLVEGRAEPFSTLDLYLVADDAFKQQLPQWVEPLGEFAFVGEAEQGWTLVTSDGLWLDVRVFPTPESIRADGLRPLFSRCTGSPLEREPRVPTDLPQRAGRFWFDLFEGAGYLAQGHAFSAHGALERCRCMLVDLYRLALTPGRQAEGWAGIELLPGVQVMDPLKGWLVAPLDIRAQRRSAHKLAAAFESLMLPLLEGLGQPYPWVMRNLAFNRLESADPDREGGIDRDAPTRPPEEQQEKTGGPARFRMKRRQQENS